jgi:hypothetical protein
MNKFFPRDPSISDFKNYYYISGIPLLIAIPLVYKKRLISLLGLLLAVALSITSGYRTVFVVSFTTIIMAWIVMTYVEFKEVNNKKNALVSMSIGVIVILYIYRKMGPIIETVSDFIMGINPTLYNQLIYKSNLLIIGSSTSDDLRQAYITHIFKYWYRYLVPYGLGYTTTIDNIKSFKDEFRFGGNTLDNTYFWFVYHYGIVVAFILFTTLIYKIIKITFAKHKTNIHLIIIIIFIPFVVSNYTFSFLSIPFHSFFTAIMLGIIFKLSTSKKSATTVKISCS